MEHLIIEDYREGYKRITPEEGYRVLDKRTDRTYSTVVCKDNHVKYFCAVEITEVW